MEKLLLTLYCIVVATLVLVTPSLGLGYYEPCDATEVPDPCNQTKYLKCQDIDPSNARCFCDNDVHYYSFELDTCIALAGSKCPVENAQLPDFPFPLSCTDHASCITSDGSNIGTCICVDSGLEKYMANPTGYCKMKFGSFGCNVNSDCNQYSHLTCNGDKYCICDKEDGLQEWGTHPDSNGVETCISLYGGDCSARPYGTPHCTPNSACTNNKCVCNDNYVPTPDNKCLLAFNQTCNSNDECHPSFECRSSESETQKRCLCPDGTIEKDGFCAALAGSTCNPATPNCIDNSYCNEQSRQCVCNTGYNQSPDKYCLGLHGSSCSDQVPYRACDPSHYVECQGSTCACSSGYHHWPEQNICQGEVGSPCSINDFCLPASHCNVTCVCNSGYESYDDGESVTCRGLEGSECTERILCDELRFLDCLQDTCACSERREFDITEDTCIALVDSPCGLLNPAVNVTLNCIENASCTPDPTNGTCTCDQDYIPDDLGGCELVTEESTEPTNATTTTPAPPPPPVEDGAHRIGFESGLTLLVLVFSLKVLSW